MINFHSKHYLQIYINCNINLYNYGYRRTYPELNAKPVLGIKYDYFRTNCRVIRIHFGFNYWHFVAERFHCVFLEINRIILNCFQQLYPKLDRYAIQQTTK